MMNPSKKFNGLPPGPRGRIVPTLQLVQNPRRAFANWIHKFGDPFLVHALNGPVVITGRSDLIREIFGHDPDDFGLFAIPTVEPILGHGSLLMMDGARHRRERKLLSPLFHGDRMKAYGEDMRSATLQHISRLSVGQTFQALNLTQAISLEVIARAIFGGRDQKSIQQMVEAAQRLGRRMSPLIFFSRRMQFRFLGLSPWDRFLAAQREVDRILEREINEARQTNIERTDILSLMLQGKYEDGERIDLESLKDELATLLFAGHETSAIAMAWALYHLHCNPNDLRRLRESIAGEQNLPQNLARNDYLKAVINESLRLNPIVTEVLRLLKSPMRLGSYELPAGMTVAPAAAIAHYNPTTFPQPEQFLPERFLDASFSPFEFFPFGGGHRRCIGAAFATYEMAIVLGTLLQRFEFELAETAPVKCRRRNVTMGPSTGIRLRVVRAF